jgi:hypothetical protein
VALISQGFLESRLYAESENLFNFLTPQVAPIFYLYRKGSFSYYNKLTGKGQIEMIQLQLANITLISVQNASSKI